VGTGGTSRSCFDSPQGQAAQHEGYIQIYLIYLILLIEIAVRNVRNSKRWKAPQKKQPGRTFVNPGLLIFPRPQEAEARIADEKIGKVEQIQIEPQQIAGTTLLQPKNHTRCPVVYLKRRKVICNFIT